MNNAKTTSGGRRAVAATIAEPHGPLSVQPVLRSRLLPRISFRFVMVFTFFAAVFYAIARAAGDGEAVAFAAVVAVLLPVVCFVLFSILFLFAWAISSFWFRDEQPDALKGSPFADGQLPPQILPPREIQG